MGKLEKDLLILYFSKFILCFEIEFVISKSIYSSLNCSKTSMEKHKYGEVHLLLCLICTIGKTYG